MSSFTDRTLTIFSNEVGKRPTPDEMRDGRIGINQADGVLSTRKPDGSVRNTDLADVQGVSTLLGRQISTSGLATGGGSLAADRTISVPKASQAEAEAGLVDDRAMTPLRTAQLFEVKGAFKVTSVALLKAAVPYIGAVAVLADSDRCGLFAWFAGDYSLGVTADTRGGCYVKANSVAATSGAWVRLGAWATEGVRSQWFGLTYVDDTAAVQAALDFASNLATKHLLHGSQLLTVTGLTVPAGVQVIGNKVGGFKQKDGNNASDLISLGLGAALVGVVVDANWSNNPSTSPARVAVRIGNSNDCLVEGCTIKNVPGYCVVVNGGLRARVKRNRFSNYYGLAVQVYGVDVVAQHEIDENEATEIGWGGFAAANAPGTKIRNNRATGTLIGRPGSRLYVNTSGTTVTWVSGPNFSALRKGNWIVLNGGAEFRIASVDSSSQLSVETSLPTLSNTQTCAGTGDLTGIVQSSFCELSGNYVQDTTTFGTGLSLGASSAACIGNKISNNTFLNCGKNAVHVSGILAGGGGWLEFNSVTDNTIISAGCGGGIGPADQVAIYVAGGSAGSVLGLYVERNKVQSFAGDGQTSHWFGHNAAGINAGQILLAGNFQVGCATAGIYNNGGDVALDDTLLPLMSGSEVVIPIPTTAVSTAVETTALQTTIPAGFHLYKATVTVTTGITGTTGASALVQAGDGGGIGNLGAGTIGTLPALTAGATVTAYCPELPAYKTGNGNVCLVFSGGSDNVASGGAVTGDLYMRCL